MRPASVWDTSIEDTVFTITDNTLELGHEPSDELVDLLFDCLLKLNSRKTRYGNTAILGEAIHNLYLKAVELEGQIKESQAPSTVS